MPSDSLELVQRIRFAIVERPIRMNTGVTPGAREPAASCGPALAHDARDGSGGTLPPVETRIRWVTGVRRKASFAARACRPFERDSGREVTAEKPHHSDLFRKRPARHRVAHRVSAEQSCTRMATPRHVRPRATGADTKQTGGALLRHSAARAFGGASAQHGSRADKLGAGCGQ